jgi:hypothetical protein
MDTIRKELADVFEEHLIDGDFSYGTLNYLAETLLKEENNLAI